MMMPWFLGNSFRYSGAYWMTWGIVPILFWSLFWKGLSLWHAARRGEKLWFVGLLVINTMGLLEIGYLLLVVRLFGDPKPQTKQKKK